MGIFNLYIWRLVKNKRNSRTIKSSNLFFLTGCIGAIKYLLIPELLNNLQGIGMGIFNLSFFIAVGVLVRQGYNWTKYVLVVLAMLTLFNLQDFEEYIDQIINSTNLTLVILASSSLAQKVIFLIATALLFKITPDTIAEEGNNIQDATTD